MISLSLDSFCKWNTFTYTQTTIFLHINTLRTVKAHKDSIPVMFYKSTNKNNISVRRFTTLVHVYFTLQHLLAKLLRNINDTK